MRLPRYVDDDEDEKFASRQYRLRKTDKNIREVVYAVVPKDGGWGWMVAFISTIHCCIMDGIHYTYGPLLMAFKEEFPNQSLASVSALNSIAVSLCFLLAPVASGLINRYGFRVCSMCGAFIFAVSYMIASHFSNYYVLLATYGITAGIGFSFINIVNSLICGFYFDRFRTIVASVVSCGSSIGVVIFGFANKKLIDLIDWDLTILFHSGLVAIIFFTSTLFLPPEYIKIIRHKKRGSLAVAPLRRRWFHKLFTLHNPHLHYLYRDDAFLTGDHRKSLPTDENIVFGTQDVQYSVKFTHDLTQEKQNKCFKMLNSVTAVIASMVNFKLLRLHSFKTYAVAAMFANLGYITPNVYIYSRNLDNGVAAAHCDYLVSIIGLSNAVGRILLGLLATFVSPVIVTSITYFIAGLTLCVSGLSYDTTYQYACCSIYGFTIASIACIKAVSLVELYGLRRLTNAFGIVLLFQGVGILIGSPLAGSLIIHFNYDVGFCMSGACIMFAGILMLVAYLIGNKEKKRRIQRRETEKKRLHDLKEAEAANIGVREATTQLIEEEDDIIQDIENERKIKISQK